MDMNNLFSKRIEICEDFFEGTELGDAVNSLLHSIHSLSSIGRDDFSEQILIMLENIIKDCWDSLEQYELDRQSERVVLYFTKNEIDFT